MPKLAPFALAEMEPRRRRPYYLLVFLAVFTTPLLLLHAGLLTLPYFWDEQGQFIPTALDLMRHGWWVARSTLPNVHPPAVELYLAGWYQLFGYSVSVTRVAMLLLAGGGLLLTFLLAIELSKQVRGRPAFWPPLFLLVSPLFFTQSMMAQLDMPAMVFTLLALLLFVQERMAAAAAACVLLVLTKETGLVTPFVFFVLLLRRRRDWQRAGYFVLPALALAAWLLLLHRTTGHWLGNPEFAHYNVGYSLHPLRMLFTFARRAYYLFVAEFRWIGTLALAFSYRRLRPMLATWPWRVALLVAAANIVVVSVFGGAELERYLLPVLPLFYIAVAVAFSEWKRAAFIPAAVALTLGLLLNLGWNPPYPFPYENNLAMVDFVRLQQTAATFAEDHLPRARIASAWPYTAGLRNPDFGYVRRRLRVVETGDFHYRSITAIPPDRYDALIVYTREWDPAGGVISVGAIRRLLQKLYGWQPEISAAQCAQLGLQPLRSWQLHGQSITVYGRSAP